MNICLAQIRSERGLVQRNIDHHMAVLRSLEPGAADLVIFPELSLSNYDPEIADAVAITPDDHRLTVFQAFADETGLAIAVGAPLKTAGKPLIAMLVFAPGCDTTIIGKHHLHADETPFFSSAAGSAAVLDMSARIGVAICYEISVPAYTAAVMTGSPALYVASVAKTPSGVAAALSTLTETAQRYSVPALMVNSVGTCEGKQAGGGSLAIDRAGRLLAQLGESAESLLFFDTKTQAATVDFRNIMNSG